MHTGSEGQGDSLDAAGVGCDEEPAAGTMTLEVAAEDTALEEDVQRALGEAMEAATAPVIEQHGVRLRPDVPAYLQDEMGNPFVLAEGVLAKRSDASLTKGNLKPRFFVLCADFWGFFHYAEEADITPAGYMRGRCGLSRLRKFSSEGARVPLHAVARVDLEADSNAFSVSYQVGENGDGILTSIHVLAPSIEAAAMWTTALEAWAEFAKAQFEESRALGGDSGGTGDAPVPTSAPPEPSAGTGDTGDMPSRSPRRKVAPRARRASMLDRIRSSVFGGEEEGGGSSEAGEEGSTAATPPAAPPSEEGPRTRRRSVVGPPPTLPKVAEEGGSGDGTEGGSGAAPGTVLGRVARRGSLLIQGSLRNLVGGEEDEASRQARAKAAKARAEAAAKAAFAKAQATRAKAEAAAAAASALDASFLVFKWPYVKAVGSEADAQRALAKGSAAGGVSRGTGKVIPRTFNEEVPEELPAGGAPPPARGLRAWAVPVPDADPRVGLDAAAPAAEGWWKDAKGHDLAVLHGWMQKKDRSSVVQTARNRYFVLTPRALLYFLDAGHASLDEQGYVHGRASGNNTSRLMGTGASLPLEAIVDVRVATEAVKVMRMATRGSASASTFSDDEDEEEGGSGPPSPAGRPQAAPTPAAAAAGGGGGGAPAAHDGDEDGLWEEVQRPTCVLEVDLGDSELIVDARNPRTRDTWAAALRVWGKLRKRKLDEETFAAFGDAAQHRMFNQVTEKGKESAKRG